MASLMDLERDLHPEQQVEPEADELEELDDSEEGENGGAYVRSSSLSRARSLARSRPIRFRLSKGTLPLVAQSGSMNAWAAIVTMMTSWRDGQVLGVEEALGRLGNEYLDAFRRNTGLPAAEKASLLASAGIAADPPTKLTPDRLERLLREKGPVWITNDERDGHVFSANAVLVVGINGSGRTDGTKVDLVDPTTGRHRTEKLTTILRKFGRGRSGQVQVLYLRDGHEGGGATAQSVFAFGYEEQKSPAAGVIAGAELGLNVIKELRGEGTDITYENIRTTEKMHPGNDASWDTKGTWKSSYLDIKSGVFEDKGGDEQSATFRLTFQHNGHSLGPIQTSLKNTNDAWGWKLHVEVNAKPRFDLSSPSRSAIEVQLIYRHKFSGPVFQDQIYRETVIIYGDGQAQRWGEWTQSGAW
jgi:hypothetical protein